MSDWLDELNLGALSSTAVKDDWLSELDALNAPEKAGKIGFFENIKRGGWGGVADKATLGIKPMFDAALLADSVNRVKGLRYEPNEAGYESYQRDQERIVDYLNEHAEIAERGLTIPAQAGTVVGDMLPFMAEFVLTGGMAAVGKKALTKGALKMITKTMGKQATKTAGRQAVRNAAVNLSGWVGAAGMRTALLPHRSLHGYIENRMPDIQISPEGQMIFKEAEESPFKSAYKAIGNQFIEMASEEAGAFIGMLGGKVANKVIPKKGVEALRRLKDAWISGGKGRTAKQFADKFATKAGFHGILEEYGEERLGDLMRIGAGLDESEGTTFEKILRALYPGNEQAAVELIAFSVPGVARAGLGMVADRARKSNPEAAAEYAGKENPTRKDLKELGIEERLNADERKELAEELKKPAEKLTTDEEFAAMLAEQAEIDAAEQAESKIQEPIEEVSPPKVTQEAQVGAQVEEKAEQFRKKGYSEKKARELAEADLPRAETVPESQEAASEIDKATSVKTASESDIVMARKDGKNLAGWKYVETENGAQLIHSTENTYIDFTAEDKKSGTQLLRKRAEAQVYAEENPIKPAEPEGDFVIKPVMQSPDLVTKSASLPNATPNVANATQEVATVTENATVEKQPWEMGREEYLREVLKPRDMNNPYPNRKLKLNKAVHQDSSMPSAAVAMANLKPGESFPWKKQNWTVKKITDSTLTVQADDGTTRRFRVDTKPMDQLMGDLEDRLMAYAHGVDVGDLRAAMLRDPDFAKHTLPERRGVLKPLTVEKATKPTKPIVSPEKGDTAQKTVTALKKKGYSQKKAEKLAAETEKPIKKEIENEQEAIIEPAPSPEVQQGETGDVVSEEKGTGKLDPTDPEQALQIVKEHADWAAGGSKFDVRYAWEGMHDGKEYFYTPKQIDTAYRTVQKSIPSPMEDVNLFAMPGKEKELTAIAQKMKRQKPQKKGKKKITIPKPKPLPKAKRKPTKEDYIKAVSVAVNKGETNYSITGVLVDGKKMVAIDGRRMFVIEGDWGKDGIFSITKKGDLGKPLEGNFPKYKDIIPEVNSRDAIVVKDLGKVWRHIQQSLITTSEDSKGVVVLVNKDGSLGFASSDPEAGHAEINVYEGAEIKKGFNPQFLLDAIGLHAKRGDTSIEVYFTERNPMLTKNEDGSTMTITMPVNIDKAETQERIDKSFGSQNKAFTKEQFDKYVAEEKADEPLRGSNKKGMRKGQVRAFTPQDFKRAAFFAGYYFEGGLREMQAFSAKMLETMGEAVRPHLKNLFAEAKAKVEAFEAKKDGQKVSTDGQKVSKPKTSGKKIEATSTFTKESAKRLSDAGVDVETMRERVSNQEQADAAREWVDGNFDEAVQIALGGTNKTGLYGNAIKAYAFDKLMEQGRIDEAMRVFNTFSPELTEQGRDISVLQEFTSPHSAFSVTKQITDQRRDQAGKKMGHGKKNRKKAVEQKVKREVTKLEKATEAKRMDIAKAQEFINSLRCV